MPAYKLHYFDFVRGLAESIRSTLHYAGQPFDDIVYSLEQWRNDPSVKAEMPFGKMPLLVTPEGKKIAQSAVILSYLADKYKLHGKNEDEKLKIDQIVDYVKDVVEGLRKWFWTSAEDEKRKLQHKYFDEEIPTFLENVDKQMEGDFIVESVSIADFAVAALVDMVNTVSPDSLQKFPRFIEHMKRVQNLKGIKQHIATRPDTKEAVLMKRL